MVYYDGEARRPLTRRESEAKENRARTASEQRDHYVSGFE